MKRGGMEEVWGNPSGGGMARAGRSGRQAKRCPNWRADKEGGKSPDRSATNQVANRRLDTRKTRVACSRAKCRYARRKQYSMSPIPRMKNSMNRAKNRGPINAARRNQKFIDTSPPVGCIGILRQEFRGYRPRYGPCSMTGRPCCILTAIFSPI
jgi:hypothetical protein